jgi:hypothetical protein
MKVGREYSKVRPDKATPWTGASNVPCRVTRLSSTPATQPICRGFSSAINTHVQPPHTAIHIPLPGSIQLVQHILHVHGVPLPCPPCLLPPPPLKHKLPTPSVHTSRLSRPNPPSRTHGRRAQWRHWRWSRRSGGGLGHPQQSCPPAFVRCPPQGARAGQPRSSHP